jgi:hypothetical protein
MLQMTIEMVYVHWLNLHVGERACRGNQFVNMLHGVENMERVPVRRHAYWASPTRLSID